MFNIFYGIQKDFKYFYYKRLYKIAMDKDYYLINDFLFKIYNDDDDYDFDEINAKYKLSRIEREYKEIFDKVAEFCKFKFNGLV